MQINVSEWYKMLGMKCCKHVKWIDVSKKMCEEEGNVFSYQCKLI